MCVDIIYHGCEVSQICARCDISFKCDVPSYLCIPLVPPQQESLKDKTVYI